MKLVVLHRKDAKYIYTQTFLLELLHVVCEESFSQVVLSAVFLLSSHMHYKSTILHTNKNFLGGKIEKALINYLSGYCPLSLWTFPLILTQHNAMHNSIRLNLL